LLNDPEIEFVCQQHVKTSDNKRYLMDLCFPQLELYYEIDEGQHSKEKHQVEDKHRMNEIIDATYFTEKRIKIYKEDQQGIKFKKLIDVNKEIDDFVKFIINRKKHYISIKKFSPWDFKNKYNPEIYIKRGYLDIKDNVGFLIKKDALRVFGYKGGHYQRALRKIEGTKKKEVWFPKLYKNKDWDNSLSDDFKEIKMKKTNKSIIIGKIEKKEWIVFAHYKNVLGQVIYKFLGEFHLSINKSSNKCWVFERKKTKIVIKKITS
tara:strand:+ start:839 stop:1627 length:789 start_codon:yes stop_codon:yes gene_type:complete